MGVGVHGQDQSSQRLLAFRAAKRQSCTLEYKGLDGRCWRMASVAPYGRLSLLTAPTALIGKVCNGSTRALQSPVQAGSKCRILTTRERVTTRAPARAARCRLD